MGLQGEQREARAAQLALEVDPRRIRAFGYRVGSFVENLVEDLEALVREPDLVGVRIQEQPRDPLGPVLSDDRTPLHSDVAGGLLDPGKERFDPRPQAGHYPISLPDGHRWSLVHGHPARDDGVGPWQEVNSWRATGRSLRSARFRRSQGLSRAIWTRRPGRAPGRSSDGTPSSRSWNGRCASRAASCWRARRGWARPGCCARPRRWRATWAHTSSA